MSIIEERGYFWWSSEPLGDRQDIPERNVAGILKISDEGRCSLELDAPLLEEGENKKTYVMNAGGINLENKAICGLLARERQRVYLCDLWVGALHRQFEANWALVGHEGFAVGMVNPTFNSLGVSLKGYEKWLCLETIRRDDDADKISFSCNKIQDDVFVVDTGRISINYRPSWIYGWYQATLTPSARLTFSPTNPLMAKDVIRKFRIIEDLFIILTDSEFCMEWPSVTLSDKSTENGYAFYFQRNKSNASPPERHECSTSFPALKADFGKIYSLWEKKSETLGAALWSYLSTRRGIKLYLENHFINLIGGLEAFHRRTNDPPTLSANDKGFIDRIAEVISDPKDRRWFCKLVKRTHLEEPALSQRLYDIFAAIPIDFDKKRLRNFSIKCANIRNAVAHYAGQKAAGDQAKFYHELIPINEALSFLYHALILTEIGVAREIIHGWINSGFVSYRIKKSFVDAELFDPKTIQQTTAKPTTPSNPQRKDVTS